MNQEKFEVCVIGAGPAGYAAAMRLFDLGKRVCIVEKDKIGGAGVHHGALSSKTLWEISQDYGTAVRTDRGYQAESVRLDFCEVLACVDSAVSEKTAQLSWQLDSLTQLSSGKIKLFSGTARFLSAN